MDSKILELCERIAEQVEARACVREWLADARAESERRARGDALLAEWFGDMERES
jgi:hypothetical protein